MGTAGTGRGDTRPTRAAGLQHVLAHEVVKPCALRDGFNGRHPQLLMQLENVPGVALRGSQKFSFAAHNVPQRVSSVGVRSWQELTSLSIAAN